MKLLKPCCKCGHWDN